MAVDKTICCRLSTFISKTLKTKAVKQKIATTAAVKKIGLLETKRPMGTLESGRDNSLCGDALQNKDDGSHRPPAHARYRSFVPCTSYENGREHSFSTTMCMPFGPSGKVS